MFVVKVFCGYLLSLSVCLIGYLCLSPSFSYHSPDVSHSAQGVCEHLYNEAMLNNRSVAQCDRRTGLQGNMYLHKCICPQTCKQNEGTLLKGDNLPVSPPSLPLLQFVVFTGPRCHITSDKGIVICIMSRVCVLFTGLRRLRTPRQRIASVGAR